MSSVYLCGKEMGLVAAPSLLKRRSIKSVGDLAQVPMLRRAQRGYGWDEWKEAIAPEWQGPDANAPEYEGFSVLLPAVLHGLGAAIMPLCVMQTYIDNGQLVRPLGETVVGRYGYHLMLPRPYQGGPYLESFCAWVIQMSQRLLPPLQPG